MKIAVTDTGREDKQKLYLDWLRLFEPSAEFIVISYTLNNGTLHDVDGLVLTGGSDIDPKFSKAEPTEKVGPYDTKRDEFEFSVLEKAFQRNIPVLGICRGLQVVNVSLGGTLIADLETAGFDKHSAKENEQIIHHAVTVKEKTRMHEIVDVVDGIINSYHHQAVKTVAEALCPSSFSPDGVIESIEWKEQEGKPYLLAVQWHPERMKEHTNPFTTKIGESFFKAVRS